MEQAISKKQQYASGIIAGLPVMLGYVPVAIAYAVDFLILLAVYGVLKKVSNLVFKRFLS